MPGKEKKKKQTELEEDLLEGEEEEVEDELEEGVDDLEEEVEDELEEEVEDEEEEGDEEKGDSAYKANYSYRIHDQDFEFDDMFKPLVTNKETEDVIRDLYVKAKGIDKVQESRDKFKTRLEESDKKYAELKDHADRTFYKSQELYNKGHKVEAVLNMFTADDVMEVANFVNQYNEADQQQRNILENNFRNNISSYDNQRTATDTERQLKEIQQRNVDMEINMSINYDPETKAIAEWYDKEYGVGAFKKKVYNHAFNRYNESVAQKTQPLSPTDYVREVKTEYSKFYDLANKSNTVQGDRQFKTIKNTSKKDRIPTAKSKGSVVGSVPLKKRPKQEQTFAMAKQLLEEEEDY